jgi:hypothetical protein
MATITLDEQQLDDGTILPKYTAEVSDDVIADLNMFHGIDAMAEIKELITKDRNAAVSSLNICG